MSPAATDWRQRAACRDVDPGVFFPAGGGVTAAARRACGGCPVQARCLQFALENGERWGTWGGLPERARAKLAGPAAPRRSPLCLSGRHLKDGPGKCPACEKERQRERPPQVRDQSARLAARRAARAAARAGKPRVRTKGIAA